MWRAFRSLQSKRGSNLSNKTSNLLKALSNSSNRIPNLSMNARSPTLLCASWKQKNSSRPCNRCEKSLTLIILLKLRKYTTHFFRRLRVHELVAKLSGPAEALHINLEEPVKARNRARHLVCVLIL